MHLRGSYRFIGVLISLSMIFGIGCIALAAFGAFESSQVFFPVNKWREDLQLQLIRDKNKIIEQQIWFANERLDNLDQMAGTRFESVAAISLVELIEDTGTNILSMERNEKQEISSQFIQLSQEVRLAISLLPHLPTRHLWAYTQLQTRIDTLIASLSHESPVDISNSAAVPSRTITETVVLPTPSPQAPLLASIQDDIVPVAAAFQEFDPHTPGGRCNSCHNFKSDCIICHDKHLPNHHYDIECTVCHKYEDWHSIELNHLASELYDCTNCHIELRPIKHFEGECSICHKTTYWLPANIAHTVIDRFPCIKCHDYERPPGHYEFPCTTCHGLISWLPVQVDHSDAALNDCMACHHSRQPANHYSAQCSYCHSSNSWSQIYFNHQAIVATNCRSCHSKDAPGSHYDAQCSNCHKTNAWLPARFNHSAINTSQCNNCHNKSNHYSAQCSYCHNTRSWGSVNFNHGIVNATNCISCHSGDAPGDHFSGQCSDCHKTSGWSPADFNHKAFGATDCIDCHSDDAPEDHYSNQCSECHSTNSWDFDHDGVRRCNTCHEPGRKRDD